ncbi:hypothetical protein EG240_06910 [Paenimyroides tangerinum]|uniref:Uncharacterized protein n=1 Tax=Paenimyroides tangerinum TaxID=2488728 RepID=A0A3P3W9X4_9FLAO|nr:hypothetical protein [Paenimyroides tangerinum]RRJ91228.1 hypothetical protein EG240_06910 [Paenimyroides tangerinum]
MKNIILIFLLFFISQIGTCQEDLENCFRVDDLSVEDRNYRYPFDKASKILFTSFDDDLKKLDLFEYERDEEQERYVVGEIMQIYFAFLKKNKSKYNPEMFNEKVELSETQKNEFTDLIYNFGNNHKDALLRWGANCYRPRNAILFFDENNQLFEFIEICFECNRYKKDSFKVDLNINCGEKLSLLKDLFEQAGIEYGIKKQL